MQETRNSYWTPPTCGKFLNDCLSEISLVMTAKSQSFYAFHWVFKCFSMWTRIYPHTKMLTQNQPTLPKGCRGDKLMWTPDPLDWGKWRVWGGQKYVTKENLHSIWYLLHNNGQCSCLSTQLKRVCYFDNCIYHQNCNCDVDMMQDYSPLWQPSENIHKVTHYSRVVIEIFTCPWRQQVTPSQMFSG